MQTLALARQLDYVQRMPIDNPPTGWFSQMDEQVLKLLEAYPQLRSAHTIFSQARQEIWPGRLTDESWQKMKQAASGLATAIRNLGDIDITLCERPTKYSSSCGHALMSNGTCALDWHIDN